MREGFDSLCGIVRDHLQKDPKGGDLFISINLRRNQIKLLGWEGDDFMLFYKHLEKGTFELPKGEKSRMSVEILSCLLRGINLSMVRRRKQYIHGA